jgi:hypothetical protein
MDLAGATERGTGTEFCLGKRTESGHPCHYELHDLGGGSKSAFRVSLEDLGTSTVQE